MRALDISRWAARRWYLLAGVRWLRWQSGLCGVYTRRVTQPVQLWRALGCAPQFRPVLPWWQPLVWRWLVVTGWLRPGRRRIL